MEYDILSNNIKIPKIGFGVYQIEVNKTGECVNNALALGYRHIDTARNYGNEREVGNAIANSKIDRKDIFLTTKISGSYHYEEACLYIEEALSKLKVDYIDLMLFHWPSGNLNNTYQAMEKYYKMGKLKAIGLSNFYGNDLIQILDNCEIKPMVNQVEAHVFFQQRDLKKDMDKLNIKLEAWSPLASGKNNIFLNCTLESIAKKHHKSVAQIALRFLMQKGFIVIPKSQHIERMKENIEILDFSLDDGDIKKIESMELNDSLFGWY